MKCEYGCPENPDGPCEGAVETRKAMTAYHFTGTPNSPEDPNRDFLACEMHHARYVEHWTEMWDMVNADIRAGIRDAEMEDRRRDMEARAEERHYQEQLEAEANEEERRRERMNDERDREY